jgi:hypothetical protein
MSKNSVLRRIFGSIETKWQDNEENCIMRSFIICTLHQKFIIRVNKARMVKWAKCKARVGEMRYAYKILIGEPENKIPLGTTFARKSRL